MYNHLSWFQNLPETPSFVHKTGADQICVNRSWNHCYIKCQIQLNELVIRTRYICYIRKPRANTLTFNFHMPVMFSNLWTPLLVLSECWLHYNVAYLKRMYSSQERVCSSVWCLRNPLPQVFCPVGLWHTTRAEKRKKKPAAIRKSCAAFLTPLAGEVHSVRPKLVALTFEQNKTHVGFENYPTLGYRSTQSRAGEQSSSFPFLWQWILFKSME